MPLYSQPRVTSAIWSGSVFQPGAVLQDIEVIKQRVYLVINTRIGSDALRPFFGTDIYSYTDRPLLIAAANIQREISDAITIWVPDVTLKSVKYTIVTANGASNVVFNVNMTWNDNALPSMSFTLNRGSFVFNGMKGMLIADAPIPYNRFAQNYLPVFTVNGIAANPAPSGAGYSDMPTLLAFAKASWSGYGKWCLSKDELVCYVKGSFSSANLKITLV